MEMFPSACNVPGQCARVCPTRELSMIANFFQSLSHHGVEYLLISGQA